MDKCTDKFCPDCAHHLYKTQAGYFCQICGRDIPADEVLTPEQAQPKRDEWSEK